MGDHWKQHLHGLAHCFLLGCIGDFRILMDILRALKTFSTVSAGKHIAQINFTEGKTGINPESRDG